RARARGPRARRSGGGGGGRGAGGGGGGGGVWVGRAGRGAAPCAGGPCPSSLRGAPAVCVGARSAGELSCAGSTPVFGVGSGMAGAPLGTRSIILKRGGKNNGLPRDCQAREVRARARAPALSPRMGVAGPTIPRARPGDEQ